MHNAITRASDACAFQKPSDTFTAAVFWTANATASSSATISAATRIWVPLKRRLQAGLHQLACLQSQRVVPATYLDQMLSLAFECIAEAFRHVVLLQALGHLDETFPARAVDQLCGERDLKCLHERGTWIT